jgi:hypothetical protein
MNLKTFRIELRAEIAKAILEHPNWSYKKIATEFGVSDWTVCAIAARNKLSRKRGRSSSSYPKKQAANV